MYGELVNPPVKPLSRRDRFQAWVTKRGRGVEYGEVLNVIGSWGIPWLGVAMTNGKIVAPLTSKVMLGTDGGAWFWALIINGFIVLASVIVGVLSGNTYNSRSWIQFFSAIFWSAIVIVAIGSGLPAPLVVGYGVPCLYSWLAAFHLFALNEMPHEKSSFPCFRFPVPWRKES